MEASQLNVLKVEYLMTRRCQFECSYCKIIEKNSLRNKEELKTFDTVRMVDFIAKTWPGAPIIFFGGEPTIRDDLPLIIRRCNEKGVKHAVISNSVRVLRDQNYVESLIDSGLSNWSTSFDGDTEELVTDYSVLKKSQNGLAALKMFRDKYGIRDLVTCITVTKKNIDHLESIIQRLSREGIWSICTPLQCPPPIFRYDYSSGDPDDLPTSEQIELVSLNLAFMARTGKFLMHNEPEWFETWPTYFRDQRWKCHDKSNLTVDADGYLRLCVDIPLQAGIHVFDLMVSSFVDQYQEFLSKKPPCYGCFWDPAFESIQRATRKGATQEEGRKSFRHELTEEQISRLIPEAQRWFMKTK